MNEVFTQGNEAQTAVLEDVLAPLQEQLSAFQAETRQFFHSLSASSQGFDWKDAALKFLGGMSIGLLVGVLMTKCLMPALTCL